MSNEQIGAMRDALLSIAAKLADQHEEPWPDGTESGRLHYWRDKAITAASALEALANASPSRDAVIEADIFKAVDAACVDELAGKPCGCIIEKGCAVAGYHDPEAAANAFKVEIVAHVLAALKSKEGER
ncbi:MAG: hypothetical protein J7500_15525 [Sphingomonas sp.]|uniref:hypothetical protein n=1 Tax=Sphingomonas sp. TaxID=28214 RepID=UPI001B2BD375|nr:hypothetical protein [Sphingomonas sp.]MBO9624117.1 hypothetical protein [Sphingomonas sp.]